jgi:hypothetical protein
MRKLLIGILALCGSGALAAQTGAPRIVPMYPDQAESDAIVIPAGSPLTVSFPPDADHNARFNGRLTLMGRYELGGYGEEAWVTLWPDSQSLAMIPQWKDRWEGGLKDLYIDNGWAFAQAVVPKDELHLLKNEDHVVRGHATIVVEDYETSVECDRAHYSARFVSLVDRGFQMAAAPVAEEEDAGC